MLELLAAVCLVRGGHDIILAAFDNFKEVSPQRGRAVPTRTPVLCWLRASVSLCVAEPHITRASSVLKVPVL